MDYFDEINAQHSLFLVGVEEPEENRLLITIKVSTVSEQQEDLVISGKIVGQARRVSMEGPGNEYELYFPTYAAYCITNESLTSFNDKEIRIGRLLCLFSESNYLNYIKANTFVEHIVDGELKHYAVNCQNHIIDIASMDGPVIKRL